MLNRNKKELEELYKIDRRVEKYMKKVIEVNEDPKFQIYMSEKEADERITQMMIRDAKREGIEKGLDQGKKEGIISKAIETAKKMQKKQFNKELIAEITGLSIKEINNLK